MKDLLMFIRRFARPYKWNVVWSVVFNFLTMFFTIFSFAFIMPILKILFKLDTTEYTYMQFGVGDFQDVLINNFYWYVTDLISRFGESTTLAMMATALVVATFVKVITAYFSDFFTIPLRNGVVRDIRNRLYAKIVSLPIGFYTNERKGDIMVASVWRRDGGGGVGGIEPFRPCKESYPDNRLSLRDARAELEAHRIRVYPVADSRLGDGHCRQEAEGIVDEGSGDFGRDTLDHGGDHRRLARGEGIQCGASDGGAV